MEFAARPPARTSAANHGQATSFYYRDPDPNRAPKHSSWRRCPGSWTFAATSKPTESGRESISQCGTRTYSPQSPAAPITAIRGGSWLRTASDSDTFPEPALVSGAYALFEAAWEAATDLAAFLDAGRPRIDAQAREVLYALGSGMTDVTAARELGMSLRTYRRRVAELLVVLGADSRFQAGVRAGELGLTRR
jgi:hypothetical protein